LTDENGIRGLTPVSGNDERYEFDALGENVGILSNAGILESAGDTYP